jgi:4-nitrophenyl phosphatase
MTNCTQVPWHTVQALIIDMDGVLWHGQRALPGLSDFFAALRARGLRFVLATNNASQTPDQYVAKLAAMGVQVEEAAILTSGQATAHFLAEAYPVQATSVYVIGEQGLRRPLLEQGFHLLSTEDAAAGVKADLVVSGLDRQLTYDKLTAAATFLARGARFIASNGDTTLPQENGVAVGNGAVLAALIAATGIQPQIIGKPEAVLYRQAMALLNAEAEFTVAVGDRLETDILGAVRAGMRSILVLSGISQLDDLDKVDYAPDWVLNDIAAIAQQLQAAE